jgi:nucleotide sugar dehydrogenase
MRITVIGGGKMGLPLACMFAQHGAMVTVCDTNHSIVEQINRGIDPHDEPGQAEYVLKNVAAGRLHAAQDTAAEVASSDAVVVLVSAQLTAHRNIDWGNLLEASREIAKGLRPGTLVSYETTVPVGGCRGTLVPVLEQGGIKAGRDFSLIFSPERVKSRLVFARLTDTPKIVGGIDPASAAAGEAFYRRWLGAPVINVGSLEAAEFVKLAGMAYRDTNIALANELSAFAERACLDIWPLLQAANTDNETALLLPGIGVGGHCTPVYPYFLIDGGMHRGVPQRLAALSREINERQPGRQIARLSSALGGLDGRHVHILGLAFRPQVRESAYSPAEALQAALRQAGAVATLEDPLWSESDLKAKGWIPGQIGQDAIEAVVLNTAHAQFTEPDFTAWRAKGVRAVLDGRNFWSREKAEAAGLIYLGVGVATGDQAAVGR